MDQLYVEGGNRINGELIVQGAKNSALPILAAARISGEETIIHNCPNLSDVDAAIKILHYLGCHVERMEHTVIIKGATQRKHDIPDHLMREMRSSIVFLGAILSRNHKALISFPGGCEDLL